MISTKSERSLTRNSNDKYSSKERTMDYTKTHNKNMHKIRSLSLDLHMTTIGCLSPFTTFSLI